MPKKKPLLTVVIPLKNTKEYHRETKRLGDCLKSLSNQTAIKQLEVVVADTDSDLYYRRKHKETCEKFKVRYIYTKTGDIWNISRARNIGIRNAKTDYVMTTDVDCIFAPNFIETIMRHMGQDKIIHCRISDLPNKYDDKLDNFTWMNKVSTLRPQHGYGGCQAFPRAWAFKVHGFDEDFKGWGADDTDFYHRAIQDKLKNVWIEKEASFFHQWHPMDNRMEDREQVNENRLRLKLTETGKLSVVRNPSGWGGKGLIKVTEKKSKKGFADIAILITTFMRDDALFQCIKSIRKYYPDIAVFVGDNGKSNKKKSDFCKSHNCTYVQAPFDCGVGATRNFVFKKIPVKYKFVMICEDDIIFAAETKLENWITLLEAKPDVGIAGGILKKQDKTKLIPQHYEAWLYAKAAMLYVERLDKFNWNMDCGVRYAYCDIVINVFMMRRQVWDSWKWDEKIKTWPEHEDFFFGLKKNTNWKVIYTDAVSMIHKSMSYDDEYSQYRMRMEGGGVFAQKWGIEHVWNSWHSTWGKPNPMRIGLLVPKSKVSKTGAKKDVIAIGVKTFMRESSLFKVLNAIKEHFPFSYKLYIVDDGPISEQKEYVYQRLEDQGHEIIKLPFNSGISMGRNHIVKKVEEEYLLIMDDDIALQDEVSIKNMKAVLDSNKDMGLCSGMLLSESGDYMVNANYQKGLRLEFDRGLLFRHANAKRLQKTNGTMYLFADQVVNFFLAKTEIFKDVKWDNQIKVGWEHLDFFLQLMKTKWKVAACLDAKAVHLIPENDPTYNYYRRSVINDYFNRKHKIHRVINRFQ